MEPESPEVSLIASCVSGYVLSPAISVSRIPKPRASRLSTCESSECQLQSTVQDSFLPAVSGQPGASPGCLATSSPFKEKESFSPDSQPATGQATCLLSRSVQEGTSGRTRVTAGPGQGLCPILEGAWGSLFKLQWALRAGGKQMPPH